jgi:hypothetical protein
MPVIGFLGGKTPCRLERRLRAFSQALNEADYVEGRDVTSRVWYRALPRCRRCRASLGRKPTPNEPCA